MNLRLKIRRITSYFLINKKTSRKFQRKKARTSLRSSEREASMMVKRMKMEKGLKKKSQRILNTRLSKLNNGSWTEAFKQNIAI